MRIMHGDRFLAVLVLLTCSFCVSMTNAADKPSPGTQYVPGADAEPQAGGTRHSSYIADVTVGEERYPIGPDSKVQPGIPEGKVMEFNLERSEVYPGFEHHGWLYVPAQYDGKTPLALMIFLDGTWFATRDGFWRTPVVLNNLIAKDEIPVMAAVFVDPGQSTERVVRQYKKGPDGSPLTDQPNSRQRSVEYKALNAEFASFVVEEVLPYVRRHVKITDDPQGRGISGCSSGGIGSFTAAWHRPDQFGKVLSFSGAFADESGGRLVGGDLYPDLIHQSDQKPIRVLLETNVGDYEESNKKLALVLDEKGYDYQLLLGQSSHCGKHGNMLFPDAMRWLWRDY